jgi:hypothetical protein
MARAAYADRLTTWEAWEDGTINPPTYPPPLGIQSR